MKFISALIIVLILGSYAHQQKSLEGRYKFEYTDGAVFDMSKINFENKTYNIETKNHVQKKGTIQYERNSAYLDEDPQTNIIISIRNEYIGKDTIPFCIHNRKSEIMNYLDHCVGAGILTKSK